jgi:hypothetical protein
MNTLTCAELLQYPGRTFTERMQLHFEERREHAATNAPAMPDVPRKPAKVAHGPLPVGRRIDIRRFVGRDRADRVANYLRAMIPRTATWSDESLRAVAERLVATVEIVE